MHDADDGPSEGDLARAAHFEALASLARGSAHELNNILLVLLGNLRLAQEAAGDRRLSIEFLNEIERAGLRASALSETLFVCAGRGKTSPCRVDLAQLVRDLVETHSPAQPGTDTPPELVFDGIEDEVILSHVSEDPLRVALGALLDNALALACPRVSLRVWIADASACAEGWDPAGLQLPRVPHACAEVRDEGPGVDPVARGRIFTPYFTTRPGHAGLGLARALGIARAHGGTIRLLDSADVGGKGTCMRLLLPLADPNGPPT